MTCKTCKTCKKNISSDEKSVEYDAHIWLTMQEAPELNPEALLLEGKSSTGEKSAKYGTHAWYLLQQGAPHFVSNGIVTEK